jgi:hypothetical protein
MDRRTFLQSAAAAVLTAMADQPSARSSNEPRVNSSAVDVFGIGKGKRACRQELILDSRQIAKSLIVILRT